MSFVIEAVEAHAGQPESSRSFLRAWNALKASCWRVAACLRGVCETDPELTQWIPGDLGMRGPLAERAWRRHGAYLMARRAHQERLRSHTAGHR